MERCDAHPARFSKTGEQLDDEKPDSHKPIEEEGNTSPAPSMEHTESRDSYFRP